MPVKHGFNQQIIALISVEIFFHILTEMGHLNVQKYILLD